LPVEDVSPLFHKVEVYYCHWIATIRPRDPIRRGTHLFWYLRNIEVSPCNGYLLEEWTSALTGYFSMVICMNMQINEI
jgi:hypothetical protein